MVATQMDPAFIKIRAMAHRIVSAFPQPDFYRQFQAANDLSQRIFKGNPLVGKVHCLVSQKLEGDFGHGLEHAVKVSRDAGTLMIIESRGEGISSQAITRRVCVAQCAGLLHDMKRKQADHAHQGAIYARKQLQLYDISRDEIEDVYCAIDNHEAFQKVRDLKPARRALTSACLYDADKFRWGPDNFQRTIWDMVSFAGLPLNLFVEQFPSKMQGLVKIKETFRTPTGQQYGPQFIDMGLAIGHKLYKEICSEFKDSLQCEPN